MRKVNNSTPLLTVCLITYNHVNHISSAIEGILSHKTSFQIHLVIADDFSVDGTRAILSEYKEKHPDLITLILQKENVGPEKNWLDLISYPDSEYIAYIEGDDYWTDPYKLQKQVEQMRRIGSVISFTGHYKEYNGHKGLNSIRSRTFGIEEFILKGRNTLPVCSSSTVYRNIKGAVEDFTKNFIGAPNGDFPFFAILLSYGNGFFLEDTTLVHRLNEGVSSRFNWETIYQTRIPVLCFLLERKKNEDIAGFLKKELRKYYWLYGLTLLKRGRVFTGFRYIISCLAIWLK